MDTNQNIENLVKTTLVVENLIITDLGDINLHFLAHKPAEYFDFIACLSYQKDLKPLQLRNTPDSLKETIGYCFKCSLIEPIILTIFAVFLTLTETFPRLVLMAHLSVCLMLLFGHCILFATLSYLLIYFILMG